MMSTAFKERLAAAYAAWADSKGKAPHIFFELMDPDIDLRSVMGTSMSDDPLGKGYRGKSAVLDYLAALAEGWEIVSIETETIVAEGDHVVWYGHGQWRNRKSLRLFDSPKADIWTLRDGKAVRCMKLFDSYAFAVAAGKIDPDQP
jgi:ketosteroid isomerase-like protein